MSKEIRVAQPDMPPLEEFIPFLESIWQKRWLTNNGEFHQQFEAALTEYLQVPYISLVCNGTLALMLAIKALDVQGEVITTPYSFVATTHALLWNNIKPVFVDIDADSFGLDPGRVEAAITEKTSAILAVHCYGYPVDIDGLQQIADRHGLALICDAAHAFGERVGGQSLLRAGDLSILSFHATKVFHTFEGGAVVVPTAAAKERIDHLRNFGFAGEIDIVDKGINAKMNELQAAYGLLQLRYVDGAIARRRRVDGAYRDALSGMEGIRVPEIPDTLEFCNHSYFPIRIPSGRDRVYESMKNDGIYCRRYFYPLLSNIPIYRAFTSASPGRLPTANAVANEILCLPMHAELTDNEIFAVVRSLRKAVSEAAS